ncbi:MAG: TusE/DsrC/DsvC family sulfur relay protein [Myxococcales bacterium]|nr:TusE/DsrC/DsvC family sulfur relay protein [Myxococcales bacterium]HQY62696.1 TusE/DsrC/DsvC family sulfur relay protein [Polyangiaceae bacterium]
MELNMEADKLDTVLARLDALSARVHDLTERQRKQDELFSEMSPILKEVMATATTRLDALEKRGYFAFGRELVGVGERIVEGFSPDDVRLLGDSVVAILETVRTLTQPEVLAVAGEASEALQKADQVEPIGILGMVRASRDEEVQKGMAVMMDVVRHVGRVAEIVAKRRAPRPADARARLAAVTGARRRPVLGVERPRASPPKPAAAQSEGGAASSTKPAEVAAVIEGVAFTRDGHLADAGAWSEGLALKLAETHGLALDAPRWAVVRFARADFEATGAAPNIRRLTQGTGVTTKDLYGLFPKAPARTIAKIAGIPKPAGCI